MLRRCETLVYPSRMRLADALATILPLFLLACGDDSAVRLDGGGRDAAGRDAGATDASRDAGAGDAGCVMGAACTPDDPCSEGRRVCAPTPACEATTIAAAADTECVGGTCDGLGACVRTETSVVAASDAERFDAFGGVVAVDGARAVVGAGRAGAGVYANAAYVLERQTESNVAGGRDPDEQRRDGRSVRRLGRHLGDAHRRGIAQHEPFERDERGRRVRLRAADRRLVDRGDAPRRVEPARRAALRARRRHRRRPHRGRLVLGRVPAGDARGRHGLHARLRAPVDGGLERGGRADGDGRGGGRRPRERGRHRRRRRGRWSAGGRHVDRARRGIGVRVRTRLDGRVEPDGQARSGGRRTDGTRSART